MEHELEEDIVIRRFLLGELPPEEQSEVEERLFLEVEYFQQLQAVKDELIDEYLYEDLSADERERFENYFLSRSEQHKDMAVAKALQRYVSKNALSAPAPSPASEPASIPPRKRPFWSFLPVRRPALQFALGAAVLLIAALGIWVVLRTIRSKNQEGAPQARQEQSQPSPPQPSPSVQEPSNGQGNQEVANKAPEGESLPANKAPGDNRAPRALPPPRQPPAPVYSFLLVPVASVRSDGEGKTNEVRLASDAEAADLRLALITETEYSRYRVTLQTDGNRTIRVWDGLKAMSGESGKEVSVRISAKLLRQKYQQALKAYRLALQGISSDGTVRDISSYPFQITK